MRKLLLTICYDGTDFCGWQKQKKPSVRTVQGVLDQACSALFHKEIVSIGCSRTDSGVHAEGQRATIEVESPIPTEKVSLALLPFLPEDLTVVKVQEVEKEFHCRYDTRAKTYAYQIWNAPYRNPVLRRYTEFVREDLDIMKMQRAADCFLGTHDFSAFCAAGSDAKTKIRTIFSFSVSKKENMVILTVTGDGFLYNMVRILAGTLIDTGRGKIVPEEIPDILLSKDRSRAGKTVSPSGLILKKIYYENPEFI